ncbi:MAG: hypothetical protein ACI9MR_000256 [Myxococcota bacterium]|jgi:hypothetical protein
MDMRLSLTRASVAVSMGWVLCVTGCSGSEVSGPLSSTDTSGDTSADTDDTAVTDTADPDSVTTDTEIDTNDTAVDTVIEDTTPPPDPDWESLSLGDVGVITGVTVVSPTEAYAASGDRVLRFNGSSWATFGEPTGEPIYGVWADGSTIIAVGANGAVATRAPGDGAWEVSDTSVTGLTVDLHDVYARSADDVWVVGDDTTVARFDGTDWTSEFALQNIDLRAVWIAPGTTGSDGVLAVGTGGQLARATNGAWSAQQIAVSGSTLYDIIGVGEDLIAVGTEATITILRPQAASWQGQLSNDTQDRDLFALAGPDEDNLYAFGENGLIVRYDGTKWTVQTVTGPFNVATDSRAAGYAEGTYMALGADGDGLTRENGDWVDLFTQPESGVRAIAGPDADSLWAVGRDGLVLRRGTQGWTSVPVETTADLNNVSVAPDGTVWAVGAVGTIVRVDDQGITYPDSLLPLDLFGVVATDTEIWACGKGGTLVSIATDGSAVTSVNSGAVADLRAVTFGGDGALWISGGFGTLRRRVGDTTPVAVSSGVGGSLNALAPSEAGVIVAGDNGIVLDATADGATIRNEQPGLFLYGASTSSTAVFVAGWNGAILRRDGDDYVAEETGVSGVLETIWHDATDAFAAGRQGTLLRRLEAP